MEISGNVTEPMTELEERFQGGLVNASVTIYFSPVATVFAIFIPRSFVFTLFLKSYLSLEMSPFFY